MEEHTTNEKKCLENGVNMFNRDWETLVSQSFQEKNALARDRQYIINMHINTEGS